MCLEQHGLVVELRSRKHIESERSHRVLDEVWVPLESADAYLKRDKLSAHVLNFLVALLLRIIVVSLIIKSNRVA